jgi:hypothetical protein
MRPISSQMDRAQWFSSEQRQSVPDYLGTRILSSFQIPASVAEPRRYGAFASGIGWSLPQTFQRKNHLAASSTIASSSMRMDAGMSRRSRFFSTMKHLPWMDPDSVKSYIRQLYAGASSLQIPQGQQGRGKASSWKRRVALARGAEHQRHQPRI